MKELRNTPWTIDRNDRIHDSIGRTVADCRYATAQGQPIIAAVNCHAKLLDALTELFAIVKGECPSILHEDESNIGFIVEQVIAEAEEVR